MDEKDFFRNIENSYKNFNRKIEIITTLKSLEKQTCQDFEMFISDNHSDYDLLDTLNRSFCNDFR